METDKIRKWLDESLVAIALLTRLPVPQPSPAAYATPARAVWAYPLAGALVALPAAALASVLLAAGTGPAIAAGVFLGATMLLTGAMHEDGLADSADGLWGGWTPKRRLEIMKDSTVGTYGVLALIVVTGLRWCACAALLAQGMGAVVAAAALSRAMMGLLMAALPAARDTGLSRRTGRPTMARVLWGLALGLLIGLIATGPAIVPSTLAGLVAALGVGLIARRKLHGQTGDILGACQQVSEVVILATLTVLVA